MTLTAGTALTLLALHSTGAPAAAQQTAVQRVMTAHAAEICAPGPRPPTAEGDLRCDGASKLAEIVGFTEGTRRVEVLTRWVDLAASPCGPPALVPAAPVRRFPGSGPTPSPAPVPPPAPLPDEVAAACDHVVTWLQRFEAALVDEPVRPDVTPVLLLTVGGVQVSRGEALATVDGGPSARACEAFAAAREAVRRIDTSSRYLQAYAVEFREDIAEVEAAGPACP